MVCFWIFAVLAVIGAFTQRARAAPLWFWAVPLLMYLSVVFLVVETPRYRTAIDPFIVLLAALALTRRACRPSGPVSHSPSSCGSSSHASRVGAAALDQRARELGREEEVAQQLAVQRVGARVEQPAEERELRRAVRLQQPAVVAAEDVAGDLADRVALRRRDEDVRDLPVALGSAPSPTSSLIVVSVWMSSTSGSASSASMICAAPANRSGRTGPAIRSSPPGAIEFSPITITRSAPSDSAGLIGAFRRVPPSKYQPAAGPPSISTAGNSGRDRRRGAHVLLGRACVGT